MALAGTAQWGPVDELVLVSSYDQFLQLFGNPVSPDATPMHYQALGYFKRGGAAYVYRPQGTSTKYGGATAAAGGAALTASATGYASIATIPASTAFFVCTKYPGVNDAGDIYVEVTDTSGDEFTLIIGTELVTTHIDRTALNTEIHRCSISTTAKDGFGRSMYMPDVLNRASLLASGLLSSTIVAADLPTNDDAAVKLGGNAYVAATTSEIVTAYAAFHSLSACMVDFIVPGDFDADTLNACVLVATTRQDCRAIVSPSVADMATARATTLDVDTWLTSITDQSPYAAAYFSTLYERDTANDKIVEVPCAGFVAGAYAYNNQVGNPWTAPAGSRRGRISARGLASSFTPAELDVLYDAKLNWIEVSPRYGLIIQGQKTLYGVHSPLSRVNAVGLFCLLRRDLTSFLEDFLNEINNDTTRTLVYSQVENYLTSIKSQQGIDKFMLVCDERNNTAQDLGNNRMNVDIYVSPPSVAEYIYLRSFVTSAGVDFEQLTVVAAE